MYTSIVWDFLFLTSYKPCNNQVPFRHHYKNIHAAETAAAGNAGKNVRKSAKRLMQKIHTVKVGALRVVSSLI